MSRPPWLHFRSVTSSRVTKCWRSCRLSSPLEPSKCQALQYFFIALRLEEGLGQTWIPQALETRWTAQVCSLVSMLAFTASCVFIFTFEWHGSSCTLTINSGSRFSPFTQPQHQRSNRSSSFLPASNLITSLCKGSGTGSKDAFSNWTKLFLMRDQMPGAPFSNRSSVVGGRGRGEAVPPNETVWTRVWRARAKKSSVYDADLD